MRVTLPLLRTLPANVPVPPGTNVVVGQSCVTAIAGAVVTAQVTLADLVTLRLPQLSEALAVKVALTEQVSAGIVTGAEKLAEAPGARLATVKKSTSPLDTFTLFSATVPVFRTVPVY